MKPLALNLSKMKKIGGDEHSSTFQHPDGHQIRIAHAPLSALQRGQITKMTIHKMADGGSVDNSDQMHAQKMQESVNRIRAKDSDPAIVQKQAQNMGLTQYEADGGEIAPNSSQMPDDKFDPDSVVGPSTAASNAEPAMSTQSFGPAEALAAITGAGVSDASAATIPGDTGQTPPTESAAQPSQAMPASNFGKPQSGGNSGLPNVSVNDLYQTGLKGIASQQSAETGMAQANLKAAQNYQAQIAADQTGWEAEKQSKMSDIQNAINDVNNNHIQPNHYLENMSVPGKISTAIGLILGGAGAHATGGQNMALQFLNNQINRDVESQKANQDTRRSILTGYQEKYKDAQVAEGMTRATMYGIYANKLQQAADAAGPGLAASRALQAKQALLNQMVPLVNNANLMQQGSKFNGQNQMEGGPGGSEPEFISYLNSAQRMNPELYKDAQSKYVPGIGVATHPVEKEDGDRLKDLNALSPMVDKAIADQKEFGMTGAWGVQNRADAASDRQALQVQLNKLTALKRLNDNEYDNYGKQVGDLGGVNAGGTLRTLQNLKSQLETDRNTGMSNMGIVPFRGSAPPTGLSSQAQKNLNAAMKNNPGVSQQDLMAELKKHGRL